MGRRRRFAPFRKVRPWQTAIVLACLLLLKLYVQQWYMEEIDYYLILLPLLVAVFYSIRALYFHRHCSEFGKFPARYDKEVLELEGRIVFIFPDTVFEKAKRKTVDAVRTMSGSEDHRGRYIHQRFLIRAKKTYPNKAILIEHNVSYGKHPIKEGLWVKVKGEYIHSSNDRHFYGRVHKTHEPYGSLEIIR